MKNITVLNATLKKVNNIPGEVFAHIHRKEKYYNELPMCILRVTDTYKHGLVFVHLLFSDGALLIQQVNNYKQFSLSYEMRFMIEQRKIYHTLLTTSLPQKHSLNCVCWLDTEDAIKKEYLKIAL